MNRRLVMASAAVGLAVAAACSLGLKVREEKPDGAEATRPATTRMTRPAQDAKAVARAAARAERERASAIANDLQARKDYAVHETEVRDWLEALSRWRQTPFIVTQMYVDPQGRLWCSSVPDGMVAKPRGHYFCESAPKVVAGEQKLIWGDGKLVLVDSKNRIWASLDDGSGIDPSLKGSTADRLASYEDGKWSFVRTASTDAATDVAVREESAIAATQPIDDAWIPSADGGPPIKAVFPTTQQRVAALKDMPDISRFVRFTAGFEDSAGNLYFVAGLWNAHAQIHRRDAAGRWTQFMFPMGTTFMDEPQMTELADGRVVFHLATKATGENGPWVGVCDRAGTWTMAPVVPLSLHADPPSVRSVAVLPDATVTCVVNGALRVVDLDGFDASRLDARLEALAPDLRSRDPKIRNRAAARLLYLPRQAAPALRKLADATSAVEASRLLRAAATQLESSDGPTAPVVLDEEFVPHAIALLSRTPDGTIRYFCRRVDDIEAGKTYESAVLSRSPTDGHWSVRVIDATRFTANSWVPMPWHGTEDAAGRIWLAGGCHIDPDDVLHQDEVRLSSVSAPDLDREGRLFYESSMVDPRSESGTYTVKQDGRWK